VAWLPTLSAPVACTTIAFRQPPWPAGWLSPRACRRTRSCWPTVLVSHPLHLERARILFEAEGLTVYTSPTSTDLAVIPWQSRAWLTAREAAGILWIYLADAGVPYEWTAPLNSWLYGRAAPSQAQD